MNVTSAKQTLDEPPYTAIEVADFFLAFANERGEQLTNLKLQKLVYYAQAWYLANYKKPLIRDSFEAWVHGPVNPDLYHAFKERGYLPIEKDVKMDEVRKEFDSSTLKFLNEVATVYMPFGAYHLEVMTHREDPWIKARGGVAADEKCNSVISLESMAQFYGEKVKNQTDNA